MSILFSPIKLRGLELENRIAVSSMCQYEATNGNASDWHLMHYGSFSLGAGGLVMTEMTNVSPEGRISARCAGMYSEDNVASWKRVVDFCKRFGVAAIGCQLGHAGRKGSTLPPSQHGTPLTEQQGAWQTISASAIPYAEGWHTPRAATKADLEKIKADYVAAAARCDRAGFDLIEIHAGHGYLFSQFLSPITNRRDDDYGGSLENRMRLLLEVFEAIRARWPQDKPIGARISATDWVDGEGFTPDEAVILAKALKDCGLDYLDVSGGGLVPYQKPPFDIAYQAPMAEKIRAEAGVTTSTVGLIADPHVAENIVASGKSDLIKIGRGALYDPRWAWHAATALGAETRYPSNCFAAQPKLRPWIFDG
jgi:2,4-dienoyl-CoA reductase-like NADH-dependent reductase (Old Yellow Enzyme family)